MPAKRARAQPTSSRPTSLQPTGAQLRTRQLILTLAICVLAIWIALPFLGALGWALILAIALWPLYRRALSRWPNRPALIAVLLTLAAALLVVLPLSLAAVSLASETQVAINWLQAAQRTGVPAPAWLGGLPMIGGRLAGWWQQHLATPQGTNTLIGSISVGSTLGWVKTAASEAAKDSAQFLITFVFLAAILARGEQLAAQVQAIARRMFGEFGADFVAKMTCAVRSTVNGTLLVSFAEGALIGVGYAITGVPQPLLFSVMTILLALIPFGAWLAFGLASAILLGSGSTLAALSLFVGAAVIMTVGDNVIQPAVIGSAVELPFIFAIIGAFGGLAMLGLLGLFIGPVVMVALLLVFEEWTRTPDAGATA